MKLSLDVLKERAAVIVSEELLESIAGGNANGCHIIAKSGDLIIYTQ